MTANLLCGALPLRQQHPHMASSGSSTGSSPETPIVLFEQTGAPFHYSALQHPDSVRLLRLEPSETGTDVLACSFLDLALSAKPEYEVLSGCWGGQVFRPVSLLVDGQSRKTTPELSQALFRFRRRDKPRLLWIQDVAINLRDTSERNGQIRMLRDILMSAQRLVVWLGDAEDDTDLVFQHLQRFEHLRPQFERVCTWPTDGNWGRRERFQAGRAVGAAIGMTPEEWQPYCTSAEVAFRKLCRRSWFSRPWSIPELTLSNDIVVVCGGHEVGQVVSHITPLSCLLRSSHSHWRYPAPASTSSTSLYAHVDFPVASPENHVGSLSSCRDAMLSRGSFPRMGDAYRMVRNCHAANRRDSVFAIATLEPHPPILIDYGLSVSEVYQQGTAALIRLHRSIQVLQRLASPIRSPDLPSWALDFSSPLQPTPSLWSLPGPRWGLGSYGSCDEYGDANNDGLWPSDRKIQPCPDPDRHPNALIMTGLRLETIAVTGPAMSVAVAAAAATTTTTTSTTTPSSQDAAHEFTTVLEAWETLALTARPRAGHVSDAFFDTLIVFDAHDIRRNRTPRPPVSSQADYAREWYTRCHSSSSSAGVLRAAEPDYFAHHPGGGGGFSLPAGPREPKWERPYGDYRDGDGSGELFGARVARACAGMRFFVTVGGGMGLAPAGAGAGDAVAFFSTGKWLMVLQPVGDGQEGGEGCYRFLGEGFLHDWWRHVEVVFDVRAASGSYSHLMTEFVVL